MSETGLVQILEGALLAAGKPLTVAQLGELFDENERPENSALREALDEIAERCEGRGFELLQVASGYRFQVRQNLSPWVGRLWQERPQRYSRALLETLALIAYRQPITRGEIEEIRGVAVSSNIIKTLHEREWIRVVGHRDVPGRPAMYATTKQFLDYFNLKSLDQLPALAEIRDLDTLNAELGFSEPESGEGDDPKEGTPELTVVGGTDHVPEAQAEDGDDIPADQALDEPEQLHTTESAPDEQGITLEAAADDLEARASAPVEVDEAALADDVDAEGAADAESTPESSADVAAETAAEAPAEHELQDVDAANPDFRG
ncbi:MAG: hypothetical protein Hals2KO_20650 [Halioglobus sp.]